MTEEHEGKPKIIVDDDWKSRAQTEKEQLQKEAESKQASAEDAAAKPNAEIPLPPASFPVLLTSLATQALAMLGQIPGPDEKPVVHLDHAKHIIDTIAMLEEKTKGNLSGEEMVMINNLLHELRMAYVTVQQKTADSAAQSDQPS